MAGNWNVLSGADRVRAYANNAADAGVQTDGYEDEILKEQRRRRERDTADEVMAARHAKALAAQRRAHEEALRAWGRRTDIYGQNMKDVEEEGPYLNLKSNEQRDFERGHRSVGDSPFSALGRNIVPALRDVALTAGEFINPLDWANIVTDSPLPGTYGYAKQQSRQRDLEGMSPQQRGEYAGVADMADMGITAASLPFMAQGIAGLAQLAKNAATRKMVNMHDRLRTVPADVDLGPMRDVMSSPLREATLALPAPKPEMDTTRWTDLMKDINRSIDEVNTPTRIPRPTPQRGGINPAELDRLQPDLGDAARTLDRINEGPRRAAAQFKVLDPWGGMSDGPLPQFAGGGKVARKLLSTAGAGALLAPDDAEAASRYDPSAFLKYVRQRFPAMFDSAKQGMKFTADTGREAGVYGKLDDALIIQPRLLVKGTNNSVAIPKDVRRELIDSPNAFDMHTHPNGNALPSTPLNNAAQNELGGDTEYYQRTGRGAPWMRPGKADNLIVSVQPRTIREPLEFGNGRGESWTHMKLGKYPSKDELSNINTYLDQNADRYEGVLPMGDMGQMVPDDAGTFSLLKHYADTGRGDFTYNLGKEVFGPGGRELATPMYEAIYNQLRKDKQLRNYAGGGSVAGMARRLAQRSMPAFVEGAAPSMSPLGALSVVKPKGGNWLNNSVEDALSELRYEAPPIKGATRTAPESYNNGASERVVWNSPDGMVVQVNEGPVGHFTRQDSMDNWIEGPLTKYVKTRMATPEDEVRRLAEQGVLHTDVTNYGNAMEGRKARSNAGMPMDNTATTEFGRGWEDLADSAVRVRTPSQYLSVVDDASYRTTSFRSNIEGSLPWLRTIDPKAKVYSVKPGIFDDLDFDHLTDELRNALDPNSGLPRHLQLTPEAVKNMSMEKAVRRVADINAWREAQKIEASQKIAGGPGQELVREYAHSPEKPNPKGLRWVELKAGEHPEGWTKGVAGRDYWKDETGQMQLYHPGEKSLESQLKYEGDTMGHCVGGYCDDVMSGRSRIFSLRDAKGEPHVTVEIDPNQIDAGEFSGNFIQGTLNQQQMLDEITKLDASGQMSAPLTGWTAKILNEGLGIPKITQIKGKQNRKPNDEYLPFVQDFVKNPPHGSPWGDVGDLENSGLRRTLDAFNSNELKMLQESGTEVPSHATQEEIDTLRKTVWPNMASGGSVAATLGGWDVLTDPTGSPAENNLSWDIFSGHNDGEQLEAVQ